MPTPPRTCSSGHSRCSPPDDPRRAPLLIELIGTLMGAGPPEDQFGGSTSWRRARIPPLGCTGGSHGSSCDCSRTRAEVVDEAETRHRRGARPVRRDRRRPRSRPHVLPRCVDQLASEPRATDAAGVRRGPSTRAQGELTHARRPRDDPADRARSLRAVHDRRDPHAAGALDADGSVNGRIAATSIEADLAAARRRYRRRPRSPRRGGRAPCRARI